MERKYSWDGEKIKEVVLEESKKHSPRDILDGLTGVRNKISQMKSSEAQLKQQLVQNENNLKGASKFEAELAVFEEKCIELQVKHLKDRVALISEECKKKALKSSEATIAKDPSAYTEDQKKNLVYLDYQRLLATDEKVAEKIAPQIISKYLYDEPCFDNPFGD